MSNLCELEIDGDAMRCINCHRTVRRFTNRGPERYRVRCKNASRESDCREPELFTIDHTQGAAEVKPIGLGDWTENLLSSVGVTKEWYLAAKEKFDLAPTCGCDARKEWLNAVSDWWRGNQDQSGIDSQE